MTELADFSGFGNDGTLGSAPAGHARLATVSGSGAPTVEVYYGNTLDVAHPLIGVDNYIRGEYTYEAWVYPVGDAQEQTVFGMAASGTTTYLDGLTIEGTVVRFRVKYENEDDTVLEWDTKYRQRLYLVATHSAEKDSLWVNNELVLEQNSTDAQRADTPFSYGHNLVRIGRTITNTATQKLNFNLITAYAKVLSPEVINRHWQFGTDQPSAEAIVNGWDGEQFPVHATGTEVFLDDTWDSEEHWDRGFASNMRVLYDSLMPQITDGVSIGAEWIRNVFLGFAGDTSIESVRLEWDGEGADVDVSLDGETWTPAVENENLSIIPPGFDAEEANLFVRVSFPGGITDDESYLDNLHIVGIRSINSQQIYGRDITIEDGTRLGWHEPIEQHQNWGVRLDTGGTITISSSNEDTPGEVHAIEVWMTDIDGDFPSTNLYTPATLIAVNDAEVPTKADVYGDMVAGNWYRVVFYFDSSFNSDIVITGPGQVGSISLYPSNWDSGDGHTTESQYWEYLGEYSAQELDVDVIAVTQSLIGTRVYSQDWEILSS